MVESGRIIDVRSYQEGVIDRNAGMMKAEKRGSKRADDGHRPEGATASGQRGNFASS